MAKIEKIKRNFDMNFKKKEKIFIYFRFLSF